jgi:hypothetical protein
MSIRHEIQALARQFDAEDNAAFDLWSWLPSYKEAKKFHGEYVDQHEPSIADIMKEASIFFSHKMNPTPEQIKEAGEFYKCPCGENHS